ncbi:unnamed protein product [Chironomus riparius]|uniref:Ninjurin a n=1 Tax=Chironomus riparius TaxID=315576 RepID=A0A9N9WPX0_9DIPT|nr:unnamed protein product [Chironomus riparius]
MSTNGHVTIALNDKEVPTANLTEINGRGRSRSRSKKRSSSRSRSSSANRTKREIDLATRDVSPFIPEDALPRQKPPDRGPEIDDDDDNNNVDFSKPSHGIDDSFFEGSENDIDGPKTRMPYPNGGGSRRGSLPPFPKVPPGYGGSDVLFPGETIPRILPDINVYQHKKTLAQGMMDLALLSSNANQLRYVLELRSRHSYYLFSLTFIIASLVMQVVVGIGLVLNSRYNVKNKDDICKADKINNLITIGILLITIVNVFISAFGVAEVS